MTVIFMASTNLLIICLIFAGQVESCLFFPLENPIHGEADGRVPDSF